jgi:hypothetical protein
VAKPQPPRPSKRWIVTLDSGREFIVYAPNRAGAVQRVIEASMAGTHAYEGAKLVLLKDLGHVVNAREAPKGY